MKVIDKMRVATEEEERVVFSFEFFSPKTEDGVENLFERMNRMVSHSPIFYDITWGTGGSTAKIILDINKKIQNMLCVETMMHLTCTNMKVKKINDAHQTIKSNESQNVPALRDDPSHGRDELFRFKADMPVLLTWRNICELNLVNTLA